jgi:pimeloyl-ACP methyl ester carboxylesterase
MPDRLRTLTLEPEPGHWLELDRLEGELPGYVFLHGLGSVRHGEKSEALLEHARARGRGFCRFDFRGHGGSSGRIGYTTVGELIRDGEAVLERIGRSILFGSSLGGLVAAFLAARRPEQVAGLVLVAPAFGFMARMERRLDVEGRMRAGEAAFHVHRRVLDDAATLDETGLPARILAPVLVAHGTDDDVVPLAFSARFLADVPHDRKQLWAVPGGDHRLNRQIGEVLVRMDALLD